MKETRKSIMEKLNKRLTQTNIKNSGKRIAKGISKHSTLITFALVTAGVAAIIHFASKEVPKAKEEVKDILADDTLTSKQKRSKTVKAVAKNCWKTTVIAISTILFVTSTSAITASNTAATVASLTNAANLAEGKVKDYEKAVDGIPDKKTKEAIKNTVAKQEGVKEFMNDRTVYLWRDRMTGIRFKATYQQIMNAGELIDARVGMERQTLWNFYMTLSSQGAIFENDDPWPNMLSGLYFEDPMNLRPDCCIMDDEGETEWFIEYRDPKSDF